MILDQLILERLTSVSRDVDMIYNKYFKDAYDYVKKYGKVDVSLLHKGVMNSEELRSRMAKKAHAIHPIRIYANTGGGNTYMPRAATIKLNASEDAWQYAQYYNSVEIAYQNVGQNKELFLQEFEPHRIKGTIHHELAHWIDDSLHNQHIAKHVDSAAKSGKSPQDNPGPIERNSQIHNIVQLRRQLRTKWDTLTFNQMIKMIPGIEVFTSQLPPEEYNKWKRNILNRMAREGLLGAGMRRAS